MKIERKQSKFEPIVITLESQKEVDQMYAMVSTFDFDDEDVDITQLIFDELDNTTIVDIRETYYQLKQGSCTFKEL